MNIKHLLLKNLNPDNNEFLQILSNISNSKKIHIYLVGGAVRDAILNLISNEIDIAVSGDIDYFFDSLSSFDIKILKKSEFNTFKIKFKSSIIDVSQTRKEAYLSKGSLPSIQPSTIKDDLTRRDFSMNSLAIEINDSDRFEIIDYFNGVNDIKNKVIKVIHDYSFKDDPTRIFRAYRFSKRLSFDIDKNTIMLIKSDNKYINNLTPARVLNEYLKIFDEDKFIDILNALNDIHIFKFFLNINVNFNNINFDQNLIPNFEYFILALSKYENNKIYLDMLNKYPIPNKILTLVKNSFHIDQSMNLYKSNRLFKVDSILLSRLQNINNLSYVLEKLINPDNSLEIDILFNKIVHSSPIISTDDLIKLGVKKGPYIGSILKNISIQKFHGNLVTKNDEVNYVMDFIN